MKDSRKTLADAARTGKVKDVVDRASRVTNRGLAQSADRLGTPRVGRDIL